MRASPLTTPKDVPTARDLIVQHFRPASAGAMKPVAKPKRRPKRKGK